jgi:hypothetical protein
MNNVRGSHTVVRIDRRTRVPKNKVWELLVTSLNEELSAVQARLLQSLPSGGMTTLTLRTVLYFI